MPGNENKHDEIKQERGIQDSDFPNLTAVVFAPPRDTNPAGQNAFFEKTYGKLPAAKYLHQPITHKDEKQEKDDKGENNEFKQQFELVLNKLYEWGSNKDFGTGENAEQCEKDKQWRLAEIKRRSQSKVDDKPNKEYFFTRYQAQNADFFQATKERLEKILFFLSYDNHPKLSDNAEKNLKEQKLKFYRKLCHALSYCSSQIDTGIQNLIDETISENAIANWLYELRKEIIRDFALIHIHQKNIPPDNEIHIETLLEQYLYDKQWGGRRNVVNDENALVAQIDANTLIAFDKFFKEKYTPEAILNCIHINVERLVNNLFEKYNLYQHDGCLTQKNPPAHEKDKKILLEELVKEFWKNIKVMFDTLDLQTSDILVEIYDADNYQPHKLRKALLKSILQTKSILKDLEIEILKIKSVKLSWVRNTKNNQASLFLWLEDNGGNVTYPPNNFSDQLVFLFKYFSASPENLSSFFDEILNILNFNGIQRILLTPEIFARCLKELKSDEREVFLGKLFEFLFKKTPVPESSLTAFCDLGELILLSQNFNNVFDYKTNTSTDAIHHFQYGAWLQQLPHTRWMHYIKLVSLYAVFLDFENYCASKQLTPDSSNIREYIDFSLPAYKKLLSRICNSKIDYSFLNHADNIDKDLRIKSWQLLPGDFNPHLPENGNQLNLLLAAVALNHRHPFLKSLFRPKMSGNYDLRIFFKEGYNLALCIKNLEGKTPGFARELIEYYFPSLLEAHVDHGIFAAGQQFVPQLSFSNWISQLGDLSSITQDQIMHRRLFWLVCSKSSDEKTRNERVTKLLQSYNSEEKQQAAQPNHDRKDALLKQTYPEIGVNRNIVQLAFIHNQPLIAQTLLKQINNIDAYSHDQKPVAYFIFFSDNIDRKDPKDIEKMLGVYNKNHCKLPAEMLTTFICEIVRGFARTRKILGEKNKREIFDKEKLKIFSEEKEIYLKAFKMLLNLLRENINFVHKNNDLEIAILELLNLTPLLSGVASELFEEIWKFGVDIYKEIDWMHENYSSKASIIGFLGAHLTKVEFQAIFQQIDINHESVKKLKFATDKLMFNIFYHNYDLQTCKNFFQKALAITHCQIKTEVDHLDFIDNSSLVLPHLLKRKDRHLLKEELRELLILGLDPLKKEGSTKITPYERDKGLINTVIIEGIKLYKQLSQASNEEKGSPSDKVKKMIDNHAKFLKLEVLQENIKKAESSYSLSKNRRKDLQIILQLQNTLENLPQEKFSETITQYLNDKTHDLHNFLKTCLDCLSPKPQKVQDDRPDYFRFLFPGQRQQQYAVHQDDSKPSVSPRKAW